MEGVEKCKDNFECLRNMKFTRLNFTRIHDFQAKLLKLGKIWQCQNEFICINLLSPEDSPSHLVVLHIKPKVVTPKYVKFQFRNLFNRFPIHRELNSWFYSTSYLHVPSLNVIADLELLTTMLLQCSHQFWFYQGNLLYCLLRSSKLSNVKLCVAMNYFSLFRMLCGVQFHHLTACETSFLAPDSLIRSKTS